MNKISTNRTSCIRCATCCAKGGPTLHVEDRPIIRGGHIGTHHLITLRKGELAYGPTGEVLQPIREELIKIAGKGKSWECIFLKKEGSSCMIYSHRPLECRILKCWDTRELLSVTCKDTLKRSDIIDPQDPILKLIEDHEKTCSLPEMETILSTFSEESDNVTPLNKLAELVRKDLYIRSKAVSVFALPLAVELFILGRPLFALLSCRGISVREEHGRIHLEKMSRNDETHDTINQRSPHKSRENDSF
jgi:Fe-S-cluster containining protein